MDKKAYPHERRKKVTRACDYCKKRKFKCIGQAPCDLCKKKNIPCQFSIVDRRTTKKKTLDDRILANVEDSIMNPQVTNLAQPRHLQHVGSQTIGTVGTESPTYEEHRHAQPPPPAPLPLPISQHAQLQQQHVYQASYQQYQQMHSMQQHHNLHPAQQPNTQYGDQMENIEFNGYQMRHPLPPIYGPGMPYQYQYQNQGQNMVQQNQALSTQSQNSQTHTPQARTPSNANIQSLQNAHLQNPNTQQDLSQGQNSVSNTPGIPNQHMNPMQSPGMPSGVHQNSTSSMHAMAISNSSYHPAQAANSLTSNTNVISNTSSNTNSAHLTPLSTPLPPITTALASTSLPAALPASFPKSTPTVVPAPIRTHSDPQPEAIPSASKLLKQAYIPKSLQPLLSFPLETSEESGSDKEMERKEKEELKAKKAAIKKLQAKSDNPQPAPPVVKAETGEITNDNAKILFDSKSSTRYIGESSPLSLLHEARNIFQQELGDSDFTSDTQGVNILDEPVVLRRREVVPLPPRHVCDVLLQQFQSNINQSWYIFHKEYFTENIVDHLYEHGYNQADPKKTILLHLSLALGILFAEISRNKIVEELPISAPNSTCYFESGFNLLRQTVDDGKLWLTEAYFLIYFFYQSSCNRSSSWLMLGNAIRHAQALGIHRRFINESYKNKEFSYHRRKLWLSLYVCDRISSILLGRPLLIYDYDWDDFDNTDELVTSEPGNQLNLKCLVEIAKISKLNGKTILNFYLSGKIDPSRAEKLAIEMKIWSMNLPREIQIDKILNYPKDSDDKKITNPTHNVQNDNFSVFALHLSQLFGIMLLSRPFFMYIAFRHKNHKQSQNPNASWRDRARMQRNESTMNHFCKASVKSSVLTIQMISFYMRQYADRSESYPAVNCTFMAGLVLGLSILHRRITPSFEDEYDTETLMKFLETSRNILTVLSPVSVTAYRFSMIVTKMKQALEQSYTDLTVPTGIIETPVVSDYSPSTNEEQFQNQKFYQFQENTPNQIYISGHGVDAGNQEEQQQQTQRDQNRRLQNHQEQLQQEQIQQQQIQQQHINQHYQNQHIQNQQSQHLQQQQRNHQNQQMAEAAAAAAAAAAASSAATGAPGTTDLESLLDLQHYFVPSGRNAGASSEDNNSTSSRTNNDSKMDNFMYNTGTSDILFDNNL